MKIRIRPMALLFYLFAVVIMTFEVWGVIVNIYIKYILSLPWILYAFVSMLLDGHSQKKSIIVYHFWLMLFPVLVMALYGILLWLFPSNVVFANFTRLCSTLIYLCISWGFGAAGYYFFKEKSIDYLFTAGVTSYFFGSVCYLIVQYGLRGIIQYAKTLFLGIHVQISYAMEVHDLTFAMGIFFLYYLYFENKSVKYHKLKVIVSALMVFFGLKRIEILAILAACLVYFLFLRKDGAISSKSTIFAVGGMAISFFFIYIIESGFLRTICTFLNVNTSGRLGIYAYATKFFKLSPGYAGVGLTYFSRMWEQLYLLGLHVDAGGGYMYGIPASVHSDILTMYIENGFWLFFLWIWFFFSTKAKKLYRISGEHSARGYLLIAVYMFVLYLTDNTFGYYSTQMMFFLVPLVLSSAEDSQGSDYQQKHQIC